MNWCNFTRHTEFVNLLSFRIIVNFSQKLICKSIRFMVNFNKLFVFRSKVKKLCIMVGQSSPYLNPCQFSQKYTGRSCERLAKNMAEKEIKLSVLSPRRNDYLKKIFEAVSVELVCKFLSYFHNFIVGFLKLLKWNFSNTVIMSTTKVLRNYRIMSLNFVYIILFKACPEENTAKDLGVDPHHMTLISGWSVPVADQTDSASTVKATSSPPKSQYFFLIYCIPIIIRISGGNN